MQESMRTRAIAALPSPSHYPSRAMMAITRRYPAHNNSLIIKQVEVDALIRRYTADNALVAKDLDLYAMAFTPRSVNKNMCYERLEFLGDSVLNVIISAYLYRRYPKEDEGFMTMMRSKLVSGAYISDLVFKHTSFGIFVRRASDMPISDKTVSMKVLEDVFEAFLGALYLDMGHSITETWLIGFIERYVDFACIVADRSNAKDILKRHFIKHLGYVPTFEHSVDEKKKVVRIRDLQGVLIALGTGTTAKEAETNASAHAIKSMGIKQ